MGDAPAAPAISPKLLELDKEDVRSFPPGKVFGRTAALVFWVRSRTLTNWASARLLCRCAAHLRARQDQKPLISDG
jgi:hypothetical protein